MTCSCGGEATRVRSRNSNGAWRLWDRCSCCGANVNGPGHWIAHARVPRWEELPIHYGEEAKHPAQVRLWDEEAAEPIFRAEATAEAEEARSAIGAGPKGPSGSQAVGQMKARAEVGR